MKQKFEYARENGFMGTFAEYLQMNYKGYCTICKRCDDIPMQFSAWLDVVSK